MFSDGRRTFFWVGCACVGAYVAYRYWKKRELKSIDEGFDEVTKVFANCIVLEIFLSYMNC